MKRRISRPNKRLLFVLAPPTAIVAMALWCYPKDLNLSGVKSGTIKNDDGQPAQLLWWTPVEDMGVMQALQKGNSVDGGIMPEDWSMDGKFFKVAELGKGPEGRVKVSLRVENGGLESSRDRIMYLAQRKDLSQTIDANRVINRWFDDHLSTD